MRKLRVRRLLVIAATVVSVCYAASGCFAHDNNEEIPESHFTLVDIEKTTLFDQGGITIAATKLNPQTENGPSLRLHVENSAVKDYVVTPQFIAINGYMTYSEVEISVAQGGEANKTITFDSSPLIAAGIKTIVEVRMSFKLADLNGSTYDTAEAVLHTSAYNVYTQTDNFKGELVVDEEGLIIKLGLLSDESALGKNVYLYAENNTDEAIVLETKDVKANGAELTHYFVRTIKPGMKLCELVTFRDADMVANGIVAIEELSMGFVATSPYGVVLDTEPTRVIFTEAN
ncbi:MAG: hypothetical protein LBL96_12205 [Clostridiales bacterium]|nr:hypothetical protein [Clostridiales bacterium]